MSIPTMKEFTVHISTVVANFEKTQTMQDDPDMLAWVATQLAETNLGNVSIYHGGECVAHYDFFDGTHVPTVWTHTPLPVGMDAIALQTKFEERALAVWGEPDYKPDFDKSNQGVHADNRYNNRVTLMAWMMYMDQAIKHFQAK